MIRRNDYKAGLYNGDVGIALKNADGQLRVWFEGDNGLRAFSPSALPAHDTVYAMTIYKIQGSEFDAATLVLPDYGVPGFDSGRERLVIFAKRSGVARAVSRRVTRIFGLAGRIGN